MLWQCSYKTLSPKRVTVSGLVRKKCPQKQALSLVLELWSVTFAFYLDSSWRFKEMVCSSQALKQLLMGSTGKLSYTFPDRGLTPGIVSVIGSHVLDIWTDSKTFSRVLSSLAPSSKWKWPIGENSMRVQKKPWICRKICLTKAELKLHLLNLLKSADSLLIVY